MTPRGTAEPQVRPGVAEDIGGLTDLYNHYVLRTPITFDTVPLTPEGRMQWFLSHPKDGPRRLMVATGRRGRVASSAGRAVFSASYGFRVPAQNSPAGAEANEPGRHVRP